MLYFTYDDHRRCALPHRGDPGAGRAGGKVFPRSRRSDPAAPARGLGRPRRGVGGRAGRSAGRVAAAGLEAPRLPALVRLRRDPPRAPDRPLPDRRPTGIRGPGAGEGPARRQRRARRRLRDRRRAGPLMREVPAALGIGAIAIACCALGPIVVGALAGAALAPLLGVVAALLLALVIGAALTWQRRRRSCAVRPEARR